MSKTYILVLDKKPQEEKVSTHQRRFEPTPVVETEYQFKYFSCTTDLMSTVVNMAKGNVKVYKMFSMDKDGETTPLTIAFHEGKLQVRDGVE